MQPMHIGAARSQSTTRTLQVLWLRCKQRSWWGIGVLMLLVVGAGLVVSPGGPASRAPLSVPCATHFRQSPASVRLDDTNTLSFFAIGDWGLDVTETPKGVTDWGVDILLRLSAAMGAFADAHPPDFVVNVGDNFYQEGTSDVDDPRWTSSFEEVFQAERLRDVYWYSMLGNHDWKGNLHPSEPNGGTMAQINHTFAASNVNRRWCMPDYNYTTTYTIKGSTRVRLVVVDSQLLVRQDPGQETGVYDQSQDIPGQDALLSWLEDALCERNADWVVLATHHFVVSSGNYFHTPGDPFRVMETQVQALLEKCGVHLLLHGHDHLTQVIQLPGGTYQVGVGAAGKTNALSTTPQEQFDEVYGVGKYKVLYSSLDSAFGAFTVDGDKERLEIQLLNEHQELVFAHVVDKGD